ncbi:MAG: Ig-like domain-containing protein, partial [Deltaproteobacteria bacterium]|nr:Ig-like domain-containing protein [Deltaproteobacteria bacterium]
MPRSLKGLVVVSLVALAALTGCGRSAPLAPGDLLSIRITPANPDLYINQIVQLTVEGIYLDKVEGEWTQVVRDITDEDDLIFRLNQSGIIDVLSEARIVGKEAGNVRLLAAFEGRETFTDINVRYATLSGIRLNPDLLEMEVGDYSQLEVIGDLSDGSEIDLTFGALGSNYSTGNQLVASVTIDGLVFALGEGETTVHVQHAEFEAFSTVRVGDGPILTRVELSPAQVNLDTGENVQLHLVGFYDDGSTTNLTNHLETTFESADSFVATVSSGGLVNALSGGETIVTATHRQFSAWAAISVSSGPNLVGLELEPSQAVLPLGGSLQLTAWALYSDNSRLDVTSQCNYVSDNPQVAMVSSGGLVNAQVAGSSEISASFDGFSDSCDVTVEDRRLISIDVVPENAVLEVGATLQLRIVGHFDDGSLGNLTASSSGTTYRSSNPTVAAVDLEGEVNAVSAGLSLI